MKIGIDARFFSSQFTGIGRYVYELTRNIFELDEKNEYVLFMNEPHFSEFKPPNGRVRKVLARAKHYSLAEQTRFLKVLNGENLDLMHFTHFNAPIFYRRPFVVTIHDLTLEFFPGKKMRRFYQRLGYQLVLRNAVKKARRIIALSKNTAKDLTELLGVDQRRISVIYAGVDSLFRQLEQSELTACAARLAFDKPFFLYTGVWRDHKNLARLIKAFGSLVRNKNLEANLVITGREDPFYPEIKELVRKLKLGDRVIFSGLVDENTLLCLYNLAQVYVFPSLYEGFGLPPLEAFACGTPVCASNAACIPEICADAAVFFDPYDIPDMAEKMLLAWQDQDLRRGLITRGLERVKDFSWRKMAQETLQVYGNF